MYYNEISNNNQNFKNVINQSIGESEKIIEELISAKKDINSNQIYPLFIDTLEESLEYEVVE